MNASATPQNLTELAQHLESVCQQGQACPESAQICRQWAELTQEVYDWYAADLHGSRGSLGSLWAEQSQIYEEILEHLDGMKVMLEKQKWSSLQALVHSFQDLLGELVESNDRLEAWRSSDKPRCLRCGWDEGPQSCPHCRVRPLRPLRHSDNRGRLVARLAGPQARLYQTLQGVLAGVTDVDEIDSCLIPILRHYEECREELSQLPVSLAEGGEPALRQLLALVTEACAGLAQIRQVARGLDAQDVEEGWHRFLQAYQAMAQIIPPLLAAPEARLGKVA